MNKEELIATLKTFKDISDYTEQSKVVKSYLLTHFVDKKAFKTNEEASRKSEFIESHYRKMYWNSEKKETINFKNVLGGDHCDYVKQSPVQMIINEAKRMKRIFAYLASNPEYFFNAPVIRQDDPISYMSFIDRDGIEKFIATQGNHRTAMGIYLQSICYDEVKINNVEIIKVNINYELLDLIEETNSKLSFYGYELYIDKCFMHIVGANYNLIKRLSLHNIEKGYFSDLFLYYDKDDLETSILENDKRIISYLNNAADFIPKMEKVYIEIRQLVNHTTNLFKNFLAMNQK
ncbi:hypothetical protein [Arcobacter sp. F2176]|uniref:hypothetical protein n=1 Tax=Arcobacter sp. F2176 TaxID=2044511 RepID=UPI00100BE44D|nr:hypothetical protein [Arcobacter sp. F2176]RXJ79334.1 hypothetical protein CRU95_14445 [Arcobacter sp. F2176]